MHNSKWLFISLLIVIFDQLSKCYVMTYITPYQPVPLLPVLNVTLAFNSGAAFSFLSEQSGWQNTFFIVLTMLISLCVLICLLRMPKQQQWQCAGLALIVGGAIGNIIDRLHYGYVIDFIDVHVGVHHWPVFNVADAAISMGVLLLVITMFHLSHDDKTTSCDEEPSPYDKKPSSGEENLSPCEEKPSSREENLSPCEENLSPCEEKPSSRDSIAGSKKKYAL